MAMVRVWVPDSKIGQLVYGLTYQGRRKVMNREYLALLLVMVE